MLRRTCLLTLYLCAAAALLSPAAQGQGDTTTYGRATFELGSAKDIERSEVSIPLAFTHGAYKGMVRPETRRGEICVIPLSPLMTGSLEMPRELKWLKSTKEYHPNPITVRAVVHNSGGDAGRNVEFKIDCDGADYILLSPISVWQPGTPYNVDVNQTSEASWLLRARPRLTGDSVEIVVTVIFDNHPDVVLHQKMWIPPTEPILLCGINPVQVTADYANNRYTPMPFDLTVSVQNAGPMATDTVYGRIELPPALKLAGADAPGQTIKKAEPGVLRQYETGTISWALSCPMYETDTSFYVSVWVRTDNADSTLCEAVVHLPAMGEPSLRCSIIMPDELLYKENTGQYEPNPFHMTLNVVNRGNVPADNVTGFLYLSSDLVLDPPDQPLRHNFGTLRKWVPGDPVESHTWTVRKVGLARELSVTECKFAVGGVSSLSGLPTDTIYGYSQTRIPGVSSHVECNLSVPEKLEWSADSGNYVPNPFTVSYTVRNTGFVPIQMKRLTCNYNGDGVALDASIAENTQVRGVSDSLFRGDSVVYSWVFVAQPSLQLRTAHFSISGMYDNDETLVCESDVFLEPLKVGFCCGGGECPYEIAFDTARQRYNPEVFIVTHRLVNYGTAALTNARIRIDKTHDPNGYIAFDSRYNDSPTQVFPQLDAGDTVTAIWHMRLVKPNLTGMTQTTEFTFSYGTDETPWMEHQCSALTVIRPAVYRKVHTGEMPGDTIQRVGTATQTLAVKSDRFGTGAEVAQRVLVCSIDSISIRADFINQRYDPMPFQLTVRVRNAGTSVADSVYVRIDVPPDLELAGADAPNHYTKVVPRKYMFPEDTASVSWMLRHPITLTETSYNIRVWIQPKNGDTTWCETQVIIPLLDAPSLRASCETPDQIEFSEEQDSYLPNPFEVNLNAVNLGGMRADSVTAFLYLPDGVELDPPGQQLRHHFGSVKRWSPGDSVPQFTWTVRWPQRLRYNKTLKFKWAVGGVGAGSGLTIDTVYSYCETDVPGLMPAMDNKCFGPVDLVWDSSNNDYSPNPFTTRLRMKNSGFVPIGIDRMTCIFHWQDGIYLDTTIIGNTELRDLDVILQPGDSVVQSWTFVARPGIVERRVQIQMIGFDDMGNPCSHMRYVRIPGVNMCLGYKDHNSTRVVDYDSSLQWYSDRRVTFSHAIYNCGEWRYSDPWMELELYDPEGYLEYDSAYPNPQRHTADVLSPGDTLFGTWHLRLAKPNTTGITQFVEYGFQYGVDGSPIDGPDWHLLRIEPAMIVGIEDPEQPGGFALAQNYPNPFSPATEITYGIPRAMHVKLTVYDALGREVASLVNGPQEAGAHRVQFSADGLCAGVYLYRLESAQGTLTRRMVVAR